MADITEVVTPENEHGEIWYKGVLLTTLTEGQTVILCTNGFKVVEDVVIKNISDIKNIGTFIYAQTNAWSSTPIYRDFEIGMTWAEFINSDYNAEQYTHYGDYYYIFGKFILNDDNTISFEGKDNNGNSHTLDVYTALSSDSGKRNGYLTPFNELISSEKPYWSTLSSSGAN